MDGLIVMLLVLVPSLAAVGWVSWLLVAGGARMHREIGDALRAPNHADRSDDRG